MSEASQLKRAKFKPLGGKNQGRELTVHFNPISLQYTVTNTMKEQSGSNKKQYVNQSTGKLTMDLIFDTTASGEDVRLYTDQVVQFMEPDGNKIPPVVQFEWGTYVFQGMVESYKETIDFFHPTGVPLRASVNLTLSRQDKVFESGPHSNADTASSMKPELVQTAPGQSASEVAARGGDARAGRVIANRNGLDNLRFPSGALTIDASVQLGTPIAFATGSASIGVSAGLGISGGAVAGVGIGASASAGASFGGSASAGVSASAGAFAGLRTTSSIVSARLDPSRLIQTQASVVKAPSSGATFEVGGQANVPGSASLQADVGASASLRSRLQFD
jgi:hypothetical protein